MKKVLDSPWSSGANAILIKGVGYKSGFYLNIKGLLMIIFIKKSHFRQKSHQKSHFCQKVTKKRVIFIKEWSKKESFLSRSGQKKSHFFDISG